MNVSKISITSEGGLIQALRDFHAVATKQGKVTSEDFHKQEELRIAISNYLERSPESAGRILNDDVATGLSGELKKPQVKSPSSDQRLRFRDVVSGREIVALNHDEPLCRLQIRSGFAGDWLLSQITNNTEKIAALNEEIRDSFGGLSSALQGNQNISGGVLIPAVLSDLFYDLARAQSVVFRAGARTVPMDAGTLRIARQVSDPVASWRGENEHVDPSQPTFGDYTVVSKFLGCIVPLTIELAEDAPNIGTIVQNAIANAMGLTLDLFALRGPASGAGPTGVRNTAGVNSVDFYSLSSSGTNFYKGISRGVRLVQDGNFPSDPSELSMITAPSVFEDFDNLRDSTGQPLMSPSIPAKLKKFATTSVPTNIGSPAASEAYIGYFPELAVFMRRGIVFEVLSGGSVVNKTTNTTENLINEFKIAIRASMRCDIVCFRPSWFSYLSNVRFA